MGPMGGGGQWGAGGGGSGVGGGGNEPVFRVQGIDQGCSAFPTDVLRALQDRFGPVDQARIVQPGVGAVTFTRPEEAARGVQGNPRVDIGGGRDVFISPMGM